MVKYYGLRYWQLLPKIYIKPPRILSILHRNSHILCSHYVLASTPVKVPYSKLRFRYPNCRCGPMLVRKGLERRMSLEKTHKSLRDFLTKEFCSRHLIFTFKMDRVLLLCEHLLCYVLCLSEREVDKKALVYIKN